MMMQLSAMQARGFNRSMCYAWFAVLCLVILLGLHLSSSKSLIYKKRPYEPGAYEDRLYHPDKSPNRIKVHSVHEEGGMSLMARPKSADSLYLKSKSGGSNQYNRPSADEVVLILKTGQSTPTDRLKAQLATFASVKYNRTPNNTMLVSDSPGTIITADFEWEISDVIADLSTFEEVTGSTKYKVYLAQNERLAANESTTTVDPPGANNAGWQLDAFKFLPAYSKAAKQFPHAKWFVGLDDDNYMFWDSLLEFLALLDHREKLYMGSAALFNDGIKFIHGGSVTISSQAAVKARFIDGASGLGKFHGEAALLCCGDGVLAMAYAEVGIRPNDQFAEFFNGEAVASSRITPQRICKPMMGLHHLTGRDIHEVDKEWSIRNGRDWTIDHSETTWAQFLDMMTTDDAAQKSDWDFAQVNDNDQKIAVAWEKDKTSEICRATCKENAMRCLAWTFLADKEECWLSPHAVVGQSASRTTSGLNVEKLKQLKDSCKSHDWRKPVLSMTRSLRI